MACAIQLSSEQGGLNRYNRETCIASSEGTEIKIDYCPHQLSELRRVLHVDDGILHRYQSLGTIGPARHHCDKGRDAQS